MKKRLLAVALLAAAAVATGYAAVPSSAPATTGQAYVAFGYDSEAMFEIIRTHGVVSTSLATDDSGAICVYLNWTPDAATSSDSTIVRIVGDTYDSDAYFGEGGVCEGGQAVIFPSGDIATYITFF